MTNTKDVINLNLTLAQTQYLHDLLAQTAGPSAVSKRVMADIMTEIKRGVDAAQQVNLLAEQNRAEHERQLEARIKDMDAAKVKSELNGKTGKVKFKSTKARKGTLDVGLDNKPYKAPDKKSAENDKE